MVDGLRNQENDFLRQYDDLLSQATNKHEWNNSLTAANRMKKYLTQNQIPYLTKEKCLAAISKIESTIHTTQSFEAFEDLFPQMIAVLSDRIKNNESFVVHVLNTEKPLKESSIASMLNVCWDLPAIILNVSGNQIVAGRASIPVKFAADTFNANHWLKECVKIFNLNCEPAIEKQTVFTSKIKNVPSKEISGADLEAAVLNAKTAAMKMFSERVAAAEKTNEMKFRKV